MNEEMEAELTEMDSKTDRLTVTEEAVLMKLFQLISEKNKSQNRIKRQ